MNLLIHLLLPRSHPRYMEYGLWTMDLTLAAAAINPPTAGKGGAKGSHYDDLDNDIGAGIDIEQELDRFTRKKG